MSLLFGNSIRNDCENLHVHPKPFKTTFKPNPCLMLIPCCGTVNRHSTFIPLIWVTISILSEATFSLWPGNIVTPFLGNINLTEKMTNLSVAWKFYQQLPDNFYSNLKPYKISFKPNLYLPSIFRGGLVNWSTTTFYNINLI